jgi:hypothetical protein
MPRMEWIRPRVVDPTGELRIMSARSTASVAGVRISQAVRRLAHAPTPWLAKAGQGSCREPPARHGPLFVNQTSQVLVRVVPIFTYINLQALPSRQKGPVPMPQSRRFGQPLRMDTWLNWSPPSSSERRADERSRVALAVKQRVGDAVFLCQAGNLSPSGIFLARPKDGLSSADSKKCSLEFGLPGTDETIAAMGRVVRATERGPYHLMGVSFSSMSSAHRRKLADYLGDKRAHQTDLQAFETY